MGVSNNLEIIAVSESQASKATTMNTALLAMELAITDQYNLNTDAATSPGFDVVLPYDDSNDLSDRTALRFFYLILDAGATDDFDVIHPDNKHLFFVRNSTSEIATIKTLSGTGPTIGPSGVLLCYCDGVNVVELDVTAGGGGVIHPKEFSMTYYGSPPASTVIAEMLVAQAVEFAADFAGSVGSVPDNPGGDYDIDVKDDGGSIGTITISAAGAFTFVTTGNNPQSVAAGSIITFVSDATPDGALTAILVTLYGTS